MIHTCDSNKFTPQKRSSNYIIGTVLSYIELFLMFPGINLFLLLCINTYIAGSSIKLVKIRGSSEPLEPPLVTGLMYVCNHTHKEPYTHSKHKVIRVNLQSDQFSDQDVIRYRCKSIAL